MAASNDSRTFPLPDTAPSRASNFVGIAKPEYSGLRIALVVRTLAEIKWRCCKKETAKRHAMGVASYFINAQARSFAKHANDVSRRDRQREADRKGREPCHIDVRAKRRTVAN